MVSIASEATVDQSDVIHNLPVGSRKEHGKDHVSGHRMSTS
jgi:hypothetical protein